MNLIANQIKYGQIKSVNFAIDQRTTWLQDSDAEMYSKRDEEKFVVGERFIRTLKKKIYNIFCNINQLVQLIIAIMHIIEQLD